MRHNIAQGLHGLALACAAAAALCMVAIVGIISAGVVMRRLGTPLHITEEVVGLLLSVTLLLGLPMVTLKSRHVRVAIVADNVRGAWAIGLSVAALILGVAFFAWLAIETIPWFEFAYDRNLKTLTTRILLYPWMAVMPLALVLSGTILIARLAGIIPQKGEVPPASSQTGGTGT
ncbi:TRAP transporter small permease [Hoeflea poritis]|uniref:TRAP transporter small permease protein n=1 Tax=Hoeflea poritis TaxID=2993659 RepID=A0ABT4VHJ2_9HYPH|nr:TRAP transporter small permease subunit [Hoeflea poritis]MDA4844168.1 TRAP transporter small permease subunit [Hoeflea poritis]